MTAQVAENIEALFYEKKETTPAPQLELVHRINPEYEFLLDAEQEYLRQARDLFDAQDNRVARYRFPTLAPSSTREFSLIDGVVVVRPGSNALALHQYQGSCEPVGRTFDQDFYVRIRHNKKTFHVYTHA